MRAVALILAVLMLVFSVYNGFREAPGLLSGEAENVRQQIVGVGQLAYAVTALLALIGLWRRRRWTLAATFAWALSTSLTGAVASIAWTEPNIGIALLAGLISAIVTGWVVWFVWYSARSWPADPN